MKTYELTPLEKLQAEKERLRDERATAERRMLFQLQYLANNWGTLLAQSVTGVFKNRLLETVENISYAGTNSATTFRTLPRKMKWGNFLVSNLPNIAQITWRIAKPALITFGTKKIMAMIFKKSKKKK